MSVLDEFDLDLKLNCITTDSASNNNAMARELESRLEERGIIWPCKERHLPCITHVINIAVDEFIKLIKTSVNAEDTANSGGIDLAQLLADIRTIAIHIRSSPQHWEQFKKVCDHVGVKSLKILLDVPTRWNSTHRMMERVIYLHKAIDRYVLDNTGDLTIITKKEWELVELLCAFLWPFKHCTDALEATRKPEVDRVFWAYNRMFNEIDDFKATLERRQARRQPWSGVLLTALEGMSAKLRKYYKRTESPSVYVDAMVLHPRMKAAIFEGNDWDEGDADKYRAEVKARYLEGYAHLPVNATCPLPASTPAIGSKRTADEMEDSDDDEYDQFRQLFPVAELDEFDKWMSAPRVDVKLGLSWWRANHMRYPRLARMMRDQCAVPPSGSGVERVFSIAGRVATWQRNQLSPKSICRIMMYKNFMDRKGRMLEVSVESVENCYDDLSEVLHESAEEEHVMVKTLEEWRKNWNAGMLKNYH